jgi:biopolymer transport protein ExbB/TolQ
MNASVTSVKVGFSPRQRSAKRGFYFRFLDLIWLGIGILFLLIMRLVPLSERAGGMLLDRHAGHSNIISVHTFIWIGFFIGLGRLLVRYRSAKAEERELDKDYLPPGEDLVLTSQDLGELYQRLRSAPTHRFLPRLLERTVTQFQGNKSIAHAHTLLDSCLDLYLHELDLGYHMIRYIVWLIPTLGFIGSVVGIGQALAVAGTTQPDDPNLLAMTTSAMSVAFNGTFLALLLSAALVFIMHISQSREERALNASAQYCLDRLINRLYEEKNIRH